MPSGSLAFSALGSFDAALRAENVNDPSRMGCNKIPISGTREETALLSFNVY